MDEDIRQLLEPDDIITMEDAASRMKPHSLVEILDNLAKRELEVLKNPIIRNDSEMKEVVLWNVAALVAASERVARVSPEISQDQIMTSKP